MHWDFRAWNLDLGLKTNTTIFLKIYLIGSRTTYCPPCFGIETNYGHFVLVPYALGLLVIDNINYFWCDYICISLQVHKVWSSSSSLLLLEGLHDQTWKDHVHNCMLCHLLNVDGLIDPILGNCSRWTLSYVVWDALHHLWIEYQIANGFVLGALSLLRFLRSHHKTSLSFSFTVMHIWLRIWRIVSKQLMMGLHLHSTY